ncbi:homoserine dehydrogenase [Helicobacter cinaedi PAGU611]|nr:homoserine dehydrogenase [Helicobacter cinaedi PAGU611]BAM32206.1 homoserine dehydrogenase [Helicobacter cinaedi CCUG 18818 = ATCC BAA-847]BBB19895.1 homoserine dehydrogenase [Helicobacter cinaedi]
MSKLVLGMVGFGVVGSSVLKAILANGEIINARAGKQIVLKSIVVRDKAKAAKKLADMNANVALSTNIDEILQDSEIDVVIELMGGVEFAYTIAQRALKAKKAFITANKAMLAYHRSDIAPLASGLPVGFEASVCGGIPIIRVLKDGLSANHILAIRGILNGTSNYILTQMQQFGKNFATALKEAQNLGYAEADPSLDINGGDAGHKLLILASLAYGIHAMPEDILIEGIADITPDDMEFANEFGYVIKLLGIAKKQDDEVELRVHPSMIKKKSMISKVDGVMNGISVIGDYVGESMYYGAGAGGEATASSVISDIVAIARGESAAMLGFSRPLEEGKLRLKDKEKIHSRYYIRLYVRDKPGVLGEVAQILGRHNISIGAFLQKETDKKNIATMLFSTHHCFEREINHALCELENIESITQKPFKMRLEDEYE